MEVREKRLRPRLTERQAEGRRPKFSLLSFSFSCGQRKGDCKGAARPRGQARGGKMRGCEKRMVFLRHADSELFEEAYFVMRRDIARRPAHRDMVAEAERILKGEDREVSVPAPLVRGKERKKEGKRGRWSFLVPFLLGVLVTALLFLALT